MITFAELDQRRKPRWFRRKLLAWLALLGALSVVVGVLLSLFWSQVVRLPQYAVLTDGSTSLTERDLVEFATVDAWYVGLGVFGGVGLGIVAWRWFKSLGWPTAVVACCAGLLAGLICWRFGGVFGPGPLAERIARAQPGEYVPIALDLRASTALFVWPLAAVIPVLVTAFLTANPEAEAIPDPEQPEPPPVV